MSLYRQAGRYGTSTLALAVAGALLVGLVGGLLLGRATSSDPTLADQVGDLRRELQPARQGIELTPTEYAQGIRGGRVISPSEYEGARAAAGRAREVVAGAREDLRALGGTRAAALERSVVALEAAVERRAEPQEVAALSRSADAALSAALGG